MTASPIGPRPAREYAAEERRKIVQEARLAAHDLLAKIERLAELDRDAEAGGVDLS
jgi:hypothetical protein